MDEMKTYWCLSCEIKIRSTQKPEKCSCGIANKIIQMYIEPSEKYLTILNNPDLFNVICNEFQKKIAGEEESCKVIFLSACGRLVENCQVASFNLLVNDEAGTGKDYIVGSVLRILPKEIYIHKTKISPAVFTYWHNKQFEPKWTWNGKVFYPEDISESVLNSDVFKVMCSSGSSATIVIKQVAYEIDINGKPVMITTTASATPNPELTRRFSILNLDGSEIQTTAIMKRHSKFKKQGIVPEYSQEIIEAQRYLRRYSVKIPFAEIIDKYFPNNSVIMRTLYPRFLDYISASACLHQFQRRKDEEGFLIATGQDYDIARKCLLKLVSNRYMIPLTINQKRILKIFEENKTLENSASHLHSSNMNFLSLPALQTNLGILAKYKILQTKLRIDTLNRDIEVFSLSESYGKKEIFEIPEFKEIADGKDTKDTKALKQHNLSTFSDEEIEKAGYTKEELTNLLN